MTKFFLKEMVENQLAFTVKFTNLTSETSLEKVRVLSVSNNGCFIELPAKSCMKGHQIRLRISIPQKKQNIEIIGKIIELEQINNQSIDVKVQFNQFIKEEWLLLLGMIDGEQTKINRIIKKLKTA